MPEAGSLHYDGEVICIKTPTAAIVTNRDQKKGAHPLEQVTSLTLYLASDDSSPTSGAVVMAGAGRCA